MLNYIVTINLIIVGLFGPFDSGNFHFCNSPSRTNSLLTDRAPQDIHMNTLPLQWIIVARVVVVALVALAAWFFYKQKKQSERLQQRFGPE